MGVAQGFEAAFLLDCDMQSHMIHLQTRFQLYSIALRSHNDAVMLSPEHVSATESLPVTMQQCCVGTAKLLAP